MSIVTFFASDLKEIPLNRTQMFLGERRPNGWKTEKSRGTDILLSEKTQQTIKKLELLVAGSTYTEDENWPGIAASKISFEPLNLFFPFGLSPTKNFIAVEYLIW